ncbi:MAG: porin [Methylophaga sp.]|nr:porin [Methylophaga sp.]
MATLKKSALATLVGAAAMAAAGAANATIVVGGENGYTFSVDGNINQFYVHTNGRRGEGNTSRVRNGLLPTFLGFNVQAPEMNGLTVGARISISPSTNGGSYFGGAGTNAMEQREAFATVDGDFGQILMGKALGLYGSHNILLDQTLYGVGATPGANGDLETTLGRIGYGYDYAYWRSQIRYTTPNMNGFQAAFAVMDAPSSLATVNDGDLRTNQPRFEADLSYATAFDGGTFKGWLSGVSQKVKADNTTIGSSSVRSQGYTIGANVNVSGFDFVAAYYRNKGLGTLGLYGDSLDAENSRRKGRGYYVQAGYTFAGTTKASYSYGESKLDRTSLDRANSVDFREKGRMHTFGIYHDVTANLKLVAEYSRMEDKYHVASSEKRDVFAIGGFVSW